MIKYLPITISEKPCLVDDDISHWFEGRELTLDHDGVYYTVNNHKFYVHDQVMIIAIKRGDQERIQPASRMRLYVKARAEPRVRKYYFSGRRRMPLEEMQEKEMMFVNLNL